MQQPGFSGAPPPPAQSTSALFPNPPDYCQFYSEENIENGLAKPPPPPIEGHYVIFGEEHNTEEEILRPLSSQMIKQLYNSDVDPRQELKWLTRSLVAAFLDLLEILIRCPEAPERQEKLEHLRLLFINTHHLINEYRPHQAREAVRLMLEVQKEERKAIVDRFEQNVTKIRASLRETFDSLPDDLDLKPELTDAIDAVLDRKPSTTDGAKSGRTSELTTKDRVMCGLADVS